MMNDQLWQDRQYIDRLKKGDRQLRRQLYEDYAPLLYSSICRLVPDRQQREQLMEKLFASIFDQLPSFDPAHQRLFSWMHAILQRLILDWHDDKS